MNNFVELLKKLKDNNSTLEKKRILQQATNQDKEILIYVLDPFRMFNITSNKITKYSGLKDLVWRDAKRLLDELHKRIFTGNDARWKIEDLLHTIKGSHRDIFLKILDKDLRVNVGAKLVNSVFKNLIPSFNVQLCQKYTKIDFLPFNNTYVSRKLDGVRVLAIKEGESFKFYSRRGKEFKTLDVLKIEMNHHFQGCSNIVLDGEICIINNKVEDFNDIVSQIKRKNYTIKNPRFLIFDYLSLEEFKKGISNRMFYERYLNLLKIDASKEYKTFRILKQTLLNDKKELTEVIEEANERGWEGLILRNCYSSYAGKRTKNLLKVKKFHEHEFKIIGVLEGEGHFKGILGAFKIEGEYGNKKIVSKVGSGFKQTFYKNEKNQPDYTKPDEKGDRVIFWNSKDILIGQIITVKFFEVCENKNKDNYSLRFPTFKMLCGVERDL